ncbi:hypothetical protein Tco_1292091 [Tanacetum coccineum]
MLFFLPYLTSDHCSTALIFPKAIQAKKRAFKFPNFVADKEEFLPLVKLLWEENVDGCQMFKTIKKLKGLKKDMKKLSLKNGDVFKNVKKLRDKLKELLINIDKALDLKQLKKEESIVLQEYVAATKDEEKLLYKKAKVKWLNVADRNNAYFHKVLKNRDHKCRINMIHDDYGNKYEGDDVSNQFDKLSEAEVNEMVRDVSDAKTKEAMFLIDGNKAPFLKVFLLYSLKELGI